MTPGGILSQRYLHWAIEVIGADRIMFATDHPFAPVPAGGARSFIEEAGLDPAQREGIASANWERVCARIRR
ncbi:hypothetical protein EAH87_14300 [Sphingomonas koreensis]|nr:hypothetical protein EAH87_14300 [Sphingomonas koreensis]